MAGAQRPGRDDRRFHLLFGLVEAAGFERLPSGIPAFLPVRMCGSDPAKGRQDQQNRGKDPFPCGRVIKASFLVMASDDRWLFSASRWL